MALVKIVSRDEFFDTMTNSVYKDNFDRYALNVIYDYYLNSCEHEELEPCDINDTWISYDCIYSFIEDFPDCEQFVSDDYETIDYKAIHDWLETKTDVLWCSSNTICFAKF